MLQMIQRHCDGNKIFPTDPEARLACSRVFPQPLPNLLHAGLVVELRLSPDDSKPIMMMLYVRSLVELTTGQGGIQQLLITPPTWT